MSDRADNPTTADGRVPDAARQGDTLAIQDLAVAYGFSVDDGDWARWRALFTDDARLDYTHSGGIAAGVDEVAAWMPEAMSVFSWTMHSVFTHEIRFTGEDTATGRVQLFNRNGVEWNGVAEFCDVGGVYLDEYRRDGDRWQFTSRTEWSNYITGGEFAAIVRGLATTTAADRPAPTG